MSQEKDLENKKKILALIDESKINETLKTRIKLFMDELHNGELEKLFEELKKSLREDKED